MLAPCRRRSAHGRTAAAGHSRVPEVAVIPTGGENDDEGDSNGECVALFARVCCELEGRAAASSAIGVGV